MEITSVNVMAAKPLKIKTMYKEKGESVISDDCQTNPIDVCHVFCVKYVSDVIG